MEVTKLAVVLHHQKQDYCNHKNEWQDGVAAEELGHRELWEWWKNAVSPAGKQRDSQKDISQTIQ